MLYFNERVKKVDNISIFQQNNIFIFDIFIFNERIREVVNY